MLETRLRLALAAARIAVWDWNVETRQVYLSEEWQALLGGKPAAEITTIDALLSMVHSDDVASLRREVIAVFKREAPAYDVDHRVRNASGDWIWIHSRGDACERDADGKVLRMIGTNVDITSRKLLELQRAHEATHDRLTGLPNRALFEDRLERACIRARRDSSLMALMYVDIDHFKAVNDTYGHSAGDQVLVEIGRRVRTCIRGTDSIARIGGDEFTVILEKLDGPAAVEDLACRVAASMGPPIACGGLVSVDATLTIGIALYGGEAEVRPSNMLTRADAALYAAKTAGRNTYRISKD